MQLVRHNREVEGNKRTNLAGLKVFILKKLYRLPIKTILKAYTGSTIQAI